MTKAFASEINPQLFKDATPKHPCVLQQRKKKVSIVDKHRKAEEVTESEDIIDFSKPLGKQSQTQQVTHGSKFVCGGSRSSDRSQNAGH